MPVDEGQSLDSQVRLRLITHNARLVDTRKELGMTQPEAAKVAGIPLYRLQMIENLKQNPTEDEMARLTCSLLQPIDYLFPEELLTAVKMGVFSRRKVELAAPEIISLTEAQRLRLTYDGETALIEEISRRLLTEEIKEVLQTLKPREQRVLELRFGLNDRRSQTLEEVGKGFGLGRERIRQIEAKALRKLRHPSRSSKLEDFLR